jgi:uncharacterized membrane protein YkvA (DUF1232 family)
MTRFIQVWKQRARALQREVHAVYLAMRDPRTPWYARLLAGAVVAYAFSPIDLIPDPIPVLGYLDDLLLVPLGIVLVLRLIPAEVMQECRQRAQQGAVGATQRVAPTAAAAVIVAIWIILIGLAAIFVIRIFI